MRALVQRVSEASVTIDQSVYSKIDAGYLILLGITESDQEDDILWLSKKISNLRLFDDENGVMNKSLLDMEGEALIVSQFTLFASTKKGNRPSYIRAAKPDISVPLYEKFVAEMERSLGSSRVSTGSFGANMQVGLVNDGPVTIWIDSDKRDY